MAAELDIAALGIREAPRMHLEEEAAVDEVADSQNSIYNQIAEHERLLAAQNGMLLFPSRSQSVTNGDGAEDLVLGAADGALHYFERVPRAYEMASNFAGLGSVFPSPATHAILAQWKAGETVYQAGELSETP